MEGTLPHRLMKEVETGNIGRVQEILKIREGERNLTEDECLRALLRAVQLNHQDIGHQLIDHAEKVFDEEEVKGRISEGRILHRAAKGNMLSLVQRMVKLISAAEYEGGESVFTGPVAEALPDMVKVLIAAGYQPRQLFTHCTISNSSAGGLHQSLVRMNEEDRKVWSQLLPHLTPDDIIPSGILCNSIRQKKGEELLSSLELLGMEFTSCISTCKYQVKACMQQALLELDVNTVKFFICHGFDVNANTCIMHVNPPLHTVLEEFYKCPSSETFNIVVELLRAGADPSVKNNRELSAEDLCIRRIDDMKNPKAPAVVIKLFLHLGLMSQKTRKAICCLPFLELGDLAREMNEPASLQCLCRKVTLSKKGIDLDRFIQTLQYPQRLKNYIMLEELEWEAFKF